MIPIPACRVVLAPGEGRFRSTELAQTRVAAGDVIGVMETALGSRDLLAPSPGIVGGLLVRDRQPVSLGQAVMWMAPA